LFAAVKRTPQIGGPAPCLLLVDGVGKGLALIGTQWRECLDHVVIFDEHHLRLNLPSYV
jgi:hypothetical protein